MPLYEYKSLEDGETIELLRPMADADKRVDDPKGKGRKFVRVHSTFALAASAGSQTGGRDPGFSRGGKSHTHSGGCACGNPHGPCQ